MGTAGSKKAVRATVQVRLFLNPRFIMFALFLTEKKKEDITWPDEDIAELIDRMENGIPDRDVLAYRSRVEKLNWDNVSWNCFSIFDNW